eukprot:TRINITY_DN1892_c2_g1_i1.p1 TRINITY_DN1892_c2_g1~~TRINITY_DN1892_c2_g1_i1.p1  ORF type:complete len:146 (-),score=42.83 TRINITY_DN1892_c2_g1_i1:371-808(-)
MSLDQYKVNNTKRGNMTTNNTSFASPFSSAAGPRISTDNTLTINITDLSNSPTVSPFKRRKGEETGDEFLSSGSPDVGTARLSPMIRRSMSTDEDPRREGGNGSGSGSGGGGGGGNRNSGGALFSLQQMFGTSSLSDDGELTKQE